MSRTAIAALSNLVLVTVCQAGGGSHNGLTAQQWEAKLRTGGLVERVTAAKALGYMGERAEEVAPTMIRMLKDRSVDIRYHCATGLGKMAGRAEEVVPALREAAKDREAKVREAALLALAQLAPEPEEKIRSLVRLLRATDEQVRGNSVRELGELAKAHPSALRGLATALRGNDSRAVNTAAYSIGYLGPKGKDAASSLVSALARHKDRVRISVVQALSRIEADPNAVVTLGMKLARSKDHGERVAGFTALGAFAGQSRTALRVVQKGLKDDDRVVRDSVLRGFSIGRKGHSSLISLLRDFLRQGDTSTQYNAICALGSIGPGARSVVPTLIPFLSGGMHLKLATLKALSSIGPGALPALPTLRRMLKDEDFNEIIRAVEVIGHLGDGARIAVPELMALLDYRVGNVRAEAAVALARLGKHSREALPRVHEMSASSTTLLKEKAEEALKIYREILAKRWSRPRESRLMTRCRPRSRSRTRLTTRLPSHRRNRRLPSPLRPRSRWGLRRRGNRLRPPLSPVRRTRALWKRWV